jgi:hypothetical protein
VDRDVAVKGKEDRARHEATRPATETADAAA